jgi:hypothetical protein
LYELRKGICTPTQLCVAVPAANLPPCWRCGACVCGWVSQPKRNVSTSTAGEAQCSLRTCQHSSLRHSSGCTPGEWPQRTLHTAAKETPASKTHMIADHPTFWHSTTGQCPQLSADAQRPLCISRTHTTERAHAAALLLGCLQQHGWLLHDDRQSAATARCGHLLAATRDHAVSKVMHTMYDVQ